MAQDRKKLITLLTIVILSSGGWLEQKASGLLLAGGASKCLFLQLGNPAHRSELGLQVTSDGLSPDIQIPNNLGNQELFFKMIFAILLVIALGIAIIYISKRFLPKITNSPNKAIQVVQTTYLGTRRAVHLIKIGNQWLLIGSTNDSITMLADVTTALAETSLVEDNNTLRV